MPQTHVRYIVISPAKDEERYIERCIVSMMKQTVLPSKWVIVDDGSRDRTLEIVERYARQCDWIAALATRRDVERLPGPGVIRAFYRGYEFARETTYDFIVKLDVDLELPPDYFERLFMEFEKDATLGIASGIYLEPQDDRWVPVKMPDYHAAGASKVIRRGCFEDIDGFVVQFGWDTVDEIKAQVRGWRTKHFPDIHFNHLRPEGSAIGLLRTSRNYGRIYYSCGGGRLFFFLKFFHRLLFGSPPFAAAFAMLYGYLDSSIQRRSRLVSDAEASAYREILNGRIKGQFAKLLPALRAH